MSAAQCRDKATSASVIGIAARCGKGLADFTGFDPDGFARVVVTPASARDDFGPGFCAGKARATGAPFCFAFT